MVEASGHAQGMETRALFVLSTLEVWDTKAGNRVPEPFGGARFLKAKAL